MADLPDTDITVLGHTDNVGSAEANQKVSDNRANAVSNYLQNKGIAKSRIVAEGHSFNDPVADNSTAEGRAQNRRVEIYISANENMIKHRRRPRPEPPRRDLHLRQREHDQGRRERHAAVVLTAMNERRMSARASSFSVAAHRINPYLCNDHKRIVHGKDHRSG